MKRPNIPIAIAESIIEIEVKSTVIDAIIGVTVKKGKAAP